MNRLDTLRVLIDEHQCDAYLITDSDAHYTFYSLAREDRRINWITQCQAQCGLAIVTLNHGAVFQVPPNYQLLAKAEVNREIWSIVDDLFQWIRENQSKLGTIGYDPRLTPLFVIQQFKDLALKKCLLRPILSTVNLVDAISNNETTPARPMLTSIWSLDELRFAGQTSEDKVKKLRLDYLLDDNNKKFTLVTTAMDEIAWLLNLRANDMECNPLFYSFMIVSNDQLVLFTDNPHEVSHLLVLVLNMSFLFAGSFF
jgi:Xaa-Pro aminopeptidase